MDKTEEKRPGTRSYADIKEPNLRIRDVLIRIRDRYTGDSKEFTAHHLTEEFGITIYDASNRIDRLRKYGCIKLSKKTRPHSYVLTEWGIRCASRWKDEKQNLCANPKNSYHGEEKQ